MSSRLIKLIWIATRETRGEKRVIRASSGQCEPKKLLPTHTHSPIISYGFFIRNHSLSINPRALSFRPNACAEINSNDDLAASQIWFVFAFIFFYFLFSIFGCLVVVGTFFSSTHSIHLFGFGIILLNCSPHFCCCCSAHINRMIRVAAHTNKRKA